MRQMMTATINPVSLVYQPPANSNVSYSPNSLNEYTAVGGVSQTNDAKGNLTG